MDTQEVRDGVSRIEQTGGSEGEWEAQGGVWQGAGDGGMVRVGRWQARRLDELAGASEHLARGLGQARQGVSDGGRPFARPAEQDDHGAGERVEARHQGIAGWVGDGDVGAFVAVQVDDGMGDGVGFFLGVLDEPGEL